MHFARVNYSRGHLSKSRPARVSLRFLEDRTMITRPARSGTLRETIGCGGSKRVQKARKRIAGLEGTRNAVGEKKRNGATEKTCSRQPVTQLTTKLFPLIARQLAHRPRRRGHRPFPTCSTRFANRTMRNFLRAARRKLESGYAHPSVSF